MSVSGGLGEDLTVDNQHLIVSVDNDDNTILLPASLDHLPPPSTCTTPTHDDTLPDAPEESLLQHVPDQHQISRSAP